MGGAMKRFFLLFIMVVFYGIFSPLASAADGARTVTILFTGSVKGMLDPCAS